MFYKVHTAMMYMHMYVYMYHVQYRDIGLRNALCNVYKAL